MSRRPTLILGDDGSGFSETIGPALRGDFDVVGTAHEAATTITIAKCLRPDAVVLDVSMSLLSAVSVATAIGTSVPTAVVVFVSSGNEKAAELIKIGGLGYVVEARTSEDVTDAIHELLEGETAAGAELTTREAEVVQLLAQGKLMKQVADLLNVSPRTVAFHKYGVMRKLGLHSSAELVRLAVSKGLVA